MSYWAILGMDLVSFSALGSGFEILLGSGLGLPRFVSGQTRSSFFSHFQSILPVFGKKISIFMEGGGIARVRFLGQVLTQPIPRQYHILKTSRKNRSNHCIYYTISKVSYYILSSIVN